MWIVPKNLHTSHFALDTAALTLDYNALSELCAQSLLVRSSPTLARTWLRKWKQDSWTQHLFGRILKPSHGASFAEKWTSCQVASLVSPSAPLAPAEETRTPDTCSPTFSEDSENWADLPLFSSKMLKESLAPSSQETRGQTPKALPFCSMSSASWSEWVTRSRQEYSARLKWAQHTNASASLFLESAQTSETQGTVLSTRTWPTPNTSDSLNPNIPHDIGRNYLRTEVIDLKQWNTPRVALADSPRGRGDPNKDAYASRLENQVQMDQPWPTPSTQETPHYEMTLTATGRRAGVSEGATSHSVNLCDAALLAEYAEMIADPSTPERLRNKLQNNSPMWLTPCAGEAIKGSKHPITRGQMMICNDPLLRVGLVQDGPRDEALYWSTPNTMDHLSQRSPEAFLRHATETRKGRTAPCNLREQVVPYNTEIYNRLKHGQRDEEPNSTLGSLHESPQERHKGTLNPRWVETLMGLPVGWTMPSCACPVTPWLMSYASSGTAWSPQQQSEPSESCGHSSTPLEDEEDEGH